MPLYEYLCDKCGTRFEVIQKFSDEPLAQHADCGGGVERLVSAPALQFKGTGWYITDYARGGAGGRKEAGSKEGESSKKEGDSGKKDTSESKKSDSKSSSTPAATSTPSSDSKK